MHGSCDGVLGEIYIGNPLIYNRLTFVPRLNVIMKWINRYFKK